MKNRVSDPPDQSVLRNKLESIQHGSGALHRKGAQDHLSHQLHDPAETVRPVSFLKHHSFLDGDLFVQQK